MLPFAWHGYRTSIRTSTWATLFSLVYGIEEVLPVEVEIPSLRVLMEAKLTEAESCQTRFDQLNLIEEKRLTAMCHDSRGKWAPNYKGPYVVKRAFLGGALILTTMDGEEFTRAVNTEVLPLSPSELVDSDTLRHVLVPNRVSAFPRGVRISSAGLILNRVVDLPQEITFGFSTNCHSTCSQSMFPPGFLSRLFSL
ncbi:hypothetical protein KIW84_044133 [Lathyrus oleraceus]|uniref:Uncharacterized protein n=1 Tax=Pisum sativum TaxID=3888 RepID=A0A9D4XFT8_PEA|nr:hypothetical protein KIW84_044133 [Pisum sativum]